jgi:hypothetical protein
MASERIILECKSMLRSTDIAGEPRRMRIPITGSEGKVDTIFRNRPCAPTTIDKHDIFLSDNLFYEGVG